MISIHIDWLTIIIRLLIAASLGGIIGWEREIRNKQAGFKTNLLVSVGSSLIMITSIYGFGDLIDHPNARFDPARLSAQVVSGIGFLGAGAIMRRSNHISGLTTAAMLWVVAGIGLSVGAGFYVPAVATTLIVVICIVVMRKIETRFVLTSVEGTMQFTLKEDILKLDDLRTVMEKERIEIHNVSVTRQDESDTSYKILTVDCSIRLKRNLEVLAIMGRFEQLNGVIEITFDWKGK